MYPCFYQFSFSEAWKSFLLFLVHQYKKICVLVDIHQNCLVQNMWWGCLSVLFISSVDGYIWNDLTIKFKIKWSACYCDETWCNTTQNKNRHQNHLLKKKERSISVWNNTAINTKTYQCLKNHAAIFHHNLTLPFPDFHAMKIVYHCLTFKILSTFYVWVNITIQTQEIHLVNWNQNLLSTSTYARKLKKN